MAIVQIGVKVEESIKEKVRSIVKTGRFRDMSDFCAEAILEKLEREDMGIQSFEEIKAMIEKTKKIEELVNKYETRLQEIEQRINSP